MAKRKKSSSDVSSSSNEDEDWQESGKSHAKSKAKQRIKKIPQEEEEKEEGEVEDEDEDEDSEGFNDGYDENLIGDEEDQIRLANMNEKEREMELFARSEKREVLKTRYEIERKLRMAKKKEMMQSQTKMRSNERRRNMEEKRKVKNAIKGLKEQREKRKQKQRLRAIDIYSSSSSSENEDDDEKAVKKKSSSSSSSSSSSDESDDDKGRRRSDKDDDDGDADAGSEEEVKEKEEDFVLTLEELSKIKISRFRVEQWCHSPFFKDTVVGCFVKVFIGLRERSSSVEKVPVYKLCQISNISEGQRTYQLEGTRTNKVVTVKHANDVKNFKLDIISNTPFTQNEFDEWKYRMERDRLELPTKDFIAKKRNDIQNAINYSYKDSDIEAIVKEKEKFKSNPVNFAVKKTELLKQKEMAEQLGNLDDVEKIAQEIEELETKAKELDLKRTQNISAISYINERNRMRNIIESEKAIMEAREKEKEQGDDPFRRRKCAPMLVHKFKPNTPTSSTPGPHDSSSALDSLIPKPGISPMKGIKTEKDSSFQSCSPKQNELPSNDLFSAHNFDIQIDFDIGGTINMSSTSNPSSSSNYSSLHPSHSLTSASSKPSTPNRRSLNLEEYKKKKGLI